MHKEFCWWRRLWIFTMASKFHILLIIFLFLFMNTYLYLQNLFISSKCVTNSDYHSLQCSVKYCLVFSPDEEIINVSYFYCISLVAHFDYGLCLYNLKHEVIQLSKVLNPHVHCVLGVICHTCHSYYAQVAISWQCD